VIKESGKVFLTIKTDENRVCGSYFYEYQSQFEYPYCFGQQLIFEIVHATSILPSIYKAHRLRRGINILSRKCSIIFG